MADWVREVCDVLKMYMCIQPRTFFGNLLIL